MSDDTEVEIIITGTVDDSVSSSVADALSEIGSLATLAVQAGEQGGDGVIELSSAMLVVANDAAQAKTSLAAVTAAAHQIGEEGSSGAELSNSLEKVSTSARTAEVATSKLHLATADAIRGYVELGAEVLSGDFSQLPQMLLSMAKDTGLLETGAEALGAAFGPVGIAVAVVAGAVASFAAKEIEAAENAGHLKDAADFSGNFQISEQAIQGVIDKLDELPHVSSDDASKTAEAVARLAGTSARDFQGITAAVAAYSASAHVSMDSARETTVKAFSDPVAYAGNFVRSLHNIRPSLIDAADAAVANKDANGAASAMLQALSENFRASIPNIAAHNSGLLDSTLNFMAYTDALVAGIPTEWVQSALVAHTAGSYKDLAAAISAAGRAKANEQNSPEALVKAADAAGDAVDPAGAGLDKAYANIDALENRMVSLDDEIRKTSDSARKLSDQTKLDGLTRQLGLAWQAADKLNDEFALSDPGVSAWMRREDAASAAAKTGSTERVKIAKDEMDHTRAAILQNNPYTDLDNSQAYQAAERKYTEAVTAAVSRGAKTQTAIVKDTSEQAVNTARETSQALIENDKIAVQQRGDLAKQLWDLLQSGDRQSTAQRLATAKNLADGIAAAEHLSAGETETLEKDLASAVVNSAQLTARQRIQIARDEVQAEAEARKQAQREQEQIDAEATKTALAVEKDKLAQNKALAEEDLAYGRITEAQMVEIEIAATQKMAKDQIDALQKQRDLWPPHSAKWEEFQGQMVQVQSSADTKIVELNAEAAKQVLQEWQGILQPIESGFSQMASSMITSGGSFGKATKQMLFSVAADYVSARIKIEFDWLAGKAAMTLGDQKWAQESILQAIFGANEQTATTVASQAAQTGVVVASQTAQTGATTAGVAARTAVTTAGVSETVVVEAAANSTTIVGDAYKAAAGAYASASQIPYIGWILGPIAAAGAFAAVMAFDVIHAEGGSERIGADGQMAILHKNESVLPARIAMPLMDLVSNGAAIANIGFAAEGGGGIQVPGALLNEIRSANSAPREPAAASIGAISTRTAPFSLSGPLSSGTFGDTAPPPLSGGIMDDIAQMIRHPASPQGSVPSTRGGDTYVIQALDTSDFRAFLGKSANRRAMADIARDRRRAGERV